MNQDKKMSDKILHHILEILSLMTGKVSVLDHLTNSLTVIEVTQDKEMTERILNHTLEIIYLLTGEEYMIVRKNTPHSHHITGEICHNVYCILIFFCVSQCDTDGHKETLGISPNSGPQSDNVDPVSEGGEDETGEKEIPPGMIQSELSAGHVRPPVVSELGKEAEPDVRSHQQVKEEEIPVNISDGLHSGDMDTISVIKEEEDERDDQEIHRVEMCSDPCAGHVWPSVGSALGKEAEPDVRSHQQVKEEEIPVNISEHVGPESFCKEEPDSEFHLTIIKSETESCPIGEVGPESFCKEEPDSEFHLTTIKSEADPCPIGETTESQRGKEHILTDGYRYRKDRSNCDGSVSWRCCKRDCRGRIKVTIEDTMTMICKHNHAPHPERNEVQKTVAEMRRRAKATVERPKQIIQQCSLGMSLEAASMLPSYKASQRTIERLRKKKNLPS
ncbi:uncharacterized protein O3C94_006261 [Discoglossus pictus]